MEKRISHGFMPLNIDISDLVKYLESLKTKENGRLIVDCRNSEIIEIVEVKNEN